MQEMERQERNYIQSKRKQKLRVDTINESESVMSQISSAHMDFSKVKLQVDEVDLEELENEQQKKQMYDDTSRAVKEALQIRRQIMQWQQDLSDGVIVRTGPSQTIVKADTKLLELQQDEWLDVDKQFTI